MHTPLYLNHFNVIKTPALSSANYAVAVISLLYSK